jgi:hypothetical protein
MPSISITSTAPASRVRSICVYSGTGTAHPTHLEAAARFGRALAARGIRLVYGGGALGLMGACAGAAQAAGGNVLGVMPAFLRDREHTLNMIENRFVPTMHDRKAAMFEESDAFVVLPGGIGTLEEVIELLSWKRLDIHDKQIVICNLGRYWSPLLELINHTVDLKYSPISLSGSFQVVEDVDDILPALVTDG